MVLNNFSAKAYLHCQSFTLGAPCPRTPKNSFLVFGEPRSPPLPPPSPRLPPEIRDFCLPLLGKGDRAGVPQRELVSVGGSRDAVDEANRDNVSNPGRNGGRAMLAPASLPARRPICDGGEQGVWGWRGVSRAVRGGNPQRTSRSDTFEVK